MKKRVSTTACIVAFTLIFALHHDFWNWADTSLVLGFMPAGMAYHVGYSLVVALFWFLVIRHAWPGAIEKHADETPG